MRNEDNEIEWYISLKKDGRVFVAFEHKDGQNGAGIINDVEAAAFKKFAGLEE